MDGPIGRLAGEQHGVVARRQLLELGFGADAIDSRVRRRALLPVHRGVYAVGHRRLSAEGRWMAAVLAGGLDAALSHGSAGGLWGLIGRRGAAPEISRPRSFRARTGIRAHQAALPADEIERVEGIRVTSVSRTLLDLAALLPARQLENAINEAEVRGLTSRVSPAELLRRYPRSRGSAALRALLGEAGPARGVSRNDFEARFAELIDSNGLPRPRLNADIAVGGRFFEVDCLWGAQRLVVELDGRAVHGTRRAFEADRRRDQLLVAEGWRVIRITWRQLREEERAIARLLAGLLAPTLKG